MLQSFSAYISEQSLFTPADRLLLTVSGGIDSMVLTELCRQAGLHFGIAHCNFQLRGQDSEDDEAFVRETAAKYKAAFHVQRFDPKSLAHAKGISTQMAARELRYPWFETIRHQFNYDYILTAHHQDDLLETLLLNLTRGTGLAGLHGILPKNGCLVRPLLFAPRSEIAAFAAQHHLIWREDSSNASTDYVRNRLRHEVIPVLREINPRVSAAAAVLAERVKATEAILEAKRKEAEAEVVRRSGSGVWLTIERLEQQVAPLELLAHWLNHYGFDYAQSKHIWANRNGQTGKQYFSATHTLTLDRGKYLVTPAHEAAPICYVWEESDQELFYAKGRMHWERVQTPVFESNPETAYFDADTLAFPLTLRLWQPGDWFCPLGMQGKRKKISDFLVDRKVPRSLKNQVYVLESAGAIVWLVGIRMDERFSIKETTDKIIKFSHHIIY